VHIARLFEHALARLEIAYSGISAAKYTTVSTSITTTESCPDRSHKKGGKQKMTKNPSFRLSYRHCDNGKGLIQIKKLYDAQAIVEK